MAAASAPSTAPSAEPAPRTTSPLPSSEATTNASKRYLSSDSSSYSSSSETDSSSLSSDSSSTTTSDSEYETSKKRHSRRKKSTKKSSEAYGSKSKKPPPKKQASKPSGAGTTPRPSTPKGKSDNNTPTSTTTKAASPPSITLKPSPREPFSTTSSPKPSNAPKQSPRDTAQKPSNASKASPRDTPSTANTAQKQTSSVRQEKQGLSAEESSSEDDEAEPVYTEKDQAIILLLSTTSTTLATFQTIRSQIGSLLELLAGENASSAATRDVIRRELLDLRQQAFDSEGLLFAVRSKVRAPANTAVSLDFFSATQAESSQIADSFKAKTLIEELSEENKQAKREIESLKKQIAKLQEENAKRPPPVAPVTPPPQQATPPQPSPRSQTATSNVPSSSAKQRRLLEKYQTQVDMLAGKVFRLETEKRLAEEQLVVAKKDLMNKRLECEERIRDLEQSHKSEVQSLTAQHRREVGALKAEIARLSKELERLQRAEAAAPFRRSRGTSAVAAVL